MVSIPPNVVDLATAEQLLKVVKATLEHWRKGKAGWPDKNLDKTLHDIAVTAEEIAALGHRMARRPRPK